MLRRTGMLALMLLILTGCAQRQKEKELESDTAILTRRCQMGDRAACRWVVEEACQNGQTASCQLLCQSGDQAACYGYNR